MCDDSAVEEIKKRIEKENVSPEGIHFIDSGNYHYMSKVLTDMVKKPFSLVVFDHHPDMQPPMFGDILSCGGWVLKVLEENEYVRDVHVIGADSKLIEQLSPEDAGKVRFYHISSDGELCCNMRSGAGEQEEVIIGNLPTEHPVYLSIDKDVLSRDEIITNWDQGDMTRERLFLLVKKLVSEGIIIGVDICGECAPDQEGIDVAGAITGNDRFNEDILGLVRAESKGV
jgi:arginase family enzyme